MADTINEVWGWSAGDRAGIIFAPTLEKAAEVLDKAYPDNDDWEVWNYFTDDVRLVVIR